MPHGRLTETAPLLKTFESGATASPLLRAVRVLGAAPRVKVSPIQVLSLEQQRIRKSCTGHHVNEQGLAVPAAPDHRARKRPRISFRVLLAEILVLTNLPRKPVCKRPRPPCLRRERVHGKAWQGEATFGVNALAVRVMIRALAVSYVDLVVLPDELHELIDGVNCAQYLLHMQILHSDFQCL